MTEPICSNLLACRSFLTQGNNDQSKMILTISMVLLRLRRDVKALKIKRSPRLDKDNGFICVTVSILSDNKNPGKYSQRDWINVTRFAGEGLTRKIGSGSWNGIVWQLIYFCSIKMTPLSLWYWRLRDSLLYQNEAIFLFSLTHQSIWIWSATIHGIRLNIWDLVE